MERCALSTLCLGLFLLIHQSTCTNKVIFISFDGFRHDYLDLAKEKGINISAFEEIRSQGFQARVNNVMITLTFPSHYAMATGRNVENHGLVGNEFHDPKTAKSYVYTNNSNNIEPEWFEYGGSEPLWATNERHGHRSSVFSWVGSEARVNNKLAFATAGVYNPSYSLTYRINRMLDWISSDSFNLAMLYFNQPDSAGHKFGPNSAEVMREVELCNAGVAYLLQRIKDTPSLSGKTNLIITSDHGMAQTDEVNKIVDVYSVIKDLEVILDESPATLGIWPNGSKIEDIVNAIDKLGKKGFKMYMRNEIPDRYLFKRNYRIAPIYLIADLGWMFKTGPSDYNHLYGMHGYDNMFPEMNPFMVASGPDIQQFTDRQSFYQVDLYPLVCALLGLDKPNRIDGKIDRVLPFMKNPPSEEFLEQFRKYADGTLQH
nr:ectonucleotide pyrophosphatase:phosphodiesterase [Hymenolepis microstoma]